MSTAPLSALPGQGPGTTGTSTRRTVGRGAGLPSGRAALGALLVTAAAVGLYSASARAANHPLTGYLVAAHDLPPGHRLVPSDLRRQPLDLSDALAGRAFTSETSLDGATTLGPVAGGELLQAGSLIRSRGGSGRELSIPVDPARAVAGTLRPGERVDLVATFGSGTSSSTETVLHDALVIDSQRGGSSLSSSGNVVLTLAVETEAEQVAVAHALNDGELLVVRSPAQDSDPSAPASTTGAETPAVAPASFVTDGRRT